MTTSPDAPTITTDIDPYGDGAIMCIIRDMMIDLAQAPFDPERVQRVAFEVVAMIDRDDIK